MQGLVGYTLMDPEYSSSYAGYKDWYIDTFNKPGFAIGIGEGKDGKPLAMEKVEEISREIEEIFLIAMQGC